jgi:hypothetical protein
MGLEDFYTVGYNNKGYETNRSVIIRDPDLHRLYTIKRRIM